MIELKQGQAYSIEGKNSNSIQIIFKYYKDAFELVLCDIIPVVS